MPLDVGFDFTRMAAEFGSTPEQIALSFYVSLFGPLTSEFIEHVRDSEWQQYLGENAPAAEDAAEVDEVNFANWDQDKFPLLDPSLKGLISYMVKFTPRERVTIEETLKDPLWDDVRGL